MTDSEIVAVLTKSFRALTPKQRENLLYHVEQGTRILCGPEESYLYQSTDGGG